MKKIFVVMIAILVLLVVSSQVVSLFVKGSESNDSPKVTNDLIKVDLKDGDTLKNLANITGEARGYYYFEASFPVSLETLDGKVLKTYIVQANDDWMTEDYVPFNFVFDYTGVTEKEVNLVFEKSNPSGMPENDFRYLVPVKLVQ